MVTIVFSLAYYYRNQMIIAIKWFILWAPRSIPDYLAPSIIISIHKKVLKSSVEPRSVIVNPKLGQASGVQNLKKLTVSVRLRAKYYEMRCEMRPLEMRIRDAPNPIRFISTLACVLLGPPIRSQSWSLSNLEVTSKLLRKQGYVPSMSLFQK